MNQISAFSKGIWRYWRFNEPSPESNPFIQKLYAFTDGRSNDFLFRMLESRRKEPDARFVLEDDSLLTPAGAHDQSIRNVVRTLKEDGVVVVPPRLNPETVRNLCQLATSCTLQTTTFGPMAADHVPGTNLQTPITETGTTNGFDPSQPRHSVYTVPRSLLLENQIIQSLLCDPYLLAVATGYLGVFPVVTKPDMWWDTDCVPRELRPRPFHVDSGCLRWLKVGINLTDTTFDSPHFVYVKGSHNPNKLTRPLTKRLVSRMNLSDKEVNDVCADRIVHVTGPAGSIVLSDTRGIHKGELSLRGNRLILYFGLEGSAFNNIDKPVPLNRVGDQLAKAMSARPFSYQFFRHIN